MQHFLSVLKDSTIQDHPWCPEGTHRAKQTGRPILRGRSHWQFHCPRHPSFHPKSRRPHLQAVGGLLGFPGLRTVEKTSELGPQRCSAWKTASMATELALLGMGKGESGTSVWQSWTCSWLNCSKRSKSYLLLRISTLHFIHTKITCKAQAVECTRLERLGPTVNVAYLVQSLCIINIGSVYVTHWLPLTPH